VAVGGDPLYNPLIMIHEEGARMKKRLIAMALLSVIVLSACQLASSVTSSLPKSAAQDTQYIFEVPTDPINVGVTLDSGRKAEAVIPIEGGSLSVSGADGTVFTLEIPADALLAETKIAMTPLQSLDGLPFGSGPALAVQLEPEGLAFNKFVTLKIQAATEIPLDQQLFYSYQGEGKNVALAIPVVESKKIQLRLMHFSGYGVTKGLLADLEPVRKRLGGDVEARLQSALAEKLGRERQRQLLGSKGEGSNIGEEMNSSFRQYIDQVLKQRIAAAGESCAAGRLAFQSALGVARQAQLIGATDIGDEIMAQALGLFDTVALVCLKEEYELCKEQHIIHRIVPVWLGTERQYQLLGLGADSSAETEVQKKARAYTEQCLSFDLVFESDGNFDPGGGGGYHSRVKAKIPLKFDSSQLRISGKSALINDEFKFKVPDCSVDSRRGGGDFTVMSMAYVPDTHSPTDELGYVRDFKLTYFPGATSESFTVTCPDSPSFALPPSPLWWGLYIVLHQSELVVNEADGGNKPDLSGMFTSDGGMPMIIPPQGFGEQGMLLEDWEVPAGELFAQKEWIKEDGGLGLTEAGTFKLYHRPK
jgi:hypothetical protein